MKTLLPPDTTEPARTDDAVDCDLFRVIDDSRYSDEFVGIAIRRRRHELSRAVQNHGRRVAEAIRKEGQRRWLSNPPMPERFTVGDCHAIADAIPFEPAPVATPTPDIDPDEVRRALQHRDRGMDSVWPPTNKVLIEAAREWLASLPPNTTTPAPTCDEPRVIESVTWCLYPVGDGTLWAISPRRTGGLVEGASSAEMRELRQMLPPDTTTAAPDAHPWTPVAGRRGGEICDVCKWAREGHDELKINRLASAVIAAARMHTHHPHARSARCDICTVIDQYDRARRDRSGTMGRA